MRDDKFSYFNVWDPADIQFTGYNQTDVFLHGQ